MNEINVKLILQHCDNIFKNGLAGLDGLTSHIDAMRTSLTQPIALKVNLALQISPSASSDRSLDEATKQNQERAKTQHQAALTELRQAPVQFKGSYQDWLKTQTAALVACEEFACATERLLEEGNKAFGRFADYIKANKVNITVANINQDEFYQQTQQLKNTIEDLSADTHTSPATKASYQLSILQDLFATITDETEKAFLVQQIWAQLRHQLKSPDGQKLLLADLDPPQNSAQLINFLTHEVGQKIQRQQTTGVLATLYFQQQMQQALNFYSAKLQSRAQEDNKILLDDSHAISALLNEQELADIETFKHYSEIEQEYADTLQEGKMAAYLHDFFKNLHDADTLIFQDITALERYLREQSQHSDSSEPSSPISDETLPADTSAKASARWISQQNLFGEDLYTQYQKLTERHPEIWQDCFSAGYCSAQNIQEKLQSFYQSPVYQQTLQQKLVNVIKLFKPMPILTHDDRINIISGGFVTLGLAAVLLAPFTGGISLGTVATVGACVGAALVMKTVGQKIFAFFSSSSYDREFYEDSLWERFQKRQLITNIRAQISPEQLVRYDAQLNKHEQTFALLKTRGLSQVMTRTAEVQRFNFIKNKLNVALQYLTDDIGRSALFGSIGAAPAFKPLPNAETLQHELSQITPSNTVPKSLSAQQCRALHELFSKLNMAISATVNGATIYQPVVVRYLAILGLQEEYEQFLALKASHGQQETDLIAFMRFIEGQQPSSAPARDVENNQRFQQVFEKIAHESLEGLRRLIEDFQQHWARLMPQPPKAAAAADDSSPVAEPPAKLPDITTITAALNTTESRLATKSSLQKQLSLIRIFNEQFALELDKAKEALQDMVTASKNQADSHDTPPDHAFLAALFNTAIMKALEIQQSTATQGSIQMMLFTRVEEVANMMRIMLPNAEKIALQLNMDLKENCLNEVLKNPEAILSRLMIPVEDKGGTTVALQPESKLTGTR